MLKRYLINTKNTKFLELEPLILEYLDLQNSNEVEIRIENNSLVVSKAVSNSSIQPPSAKAGSKSKSQHIREFFNDGRLNIGDELIFYSAVEENKAAHNDAAIQAVISADANGNRYYLTSKADNKLYSLSGLRRKIIDDFKLTTVNRDWVFNINNEWRLLKTNQKLSEL